jgi:hypothetical protein
MFEICKASANFRKSEQKCQNSWYDKTKISGGYMIGGVGLAIHDKVLVGSLGNAMLQKLLTQTPTARECDRENENLESWDKTGGEPSAGSVFRGFERAVEEQSSILSE